jgi:DNA-binding transcriptional LysR family regulator
VKLKHLEVFHAVMLTGTLSGAARLLHLTQPGATQALQSAERQLGYALFTRQSNRLVPTAEAQALLPEVARLMGQLETVRRLAEAQRSGRTAPLRVLVVPSLAVVQLPAALRRFRRRHAQAALSIRTLHSREIAQALALREADVGIVYAPPPLAGVEPAPWPGLQALPLASGRLVCVARRRVGRSATVTLAELARQPFIRIDSREPMGALLAEQAHRAGVAAGAEGEIVVHTHHTALVLAEQGFGAAVVDSFTAAAARHSGLRVQPLAPEVRVNLLALLPPEPHERRLALAFAEAFRDAVAADEAPGPAP